MKNLPKCLLLALGLSVAGTVGGYAQERPANEAWTLEEALEYARLHNLQVRQSLVQKEVAEVDLRQSKYALLPTAVANASHTYNYGSSVDPLTSEFRTEQIRSNNISASSVVPLFQGFQLRKQIQQNRLDLAANTKDVAATQNDIMLQIVTAYLNILFADEVAKAAELQQATTQQQLERTRILFKAGSVAETNVLELESQLASDELNLINAQNQIDVARLTLVQLLNLGNPEDFDVVIPEIPEPALDATIVAPDQVYDVAVQVLPEIEAADLRVQSAEVGVGIARAAYYPRLSFSAAIFTGYSSGRVFPFPETIEGVFNRQLVGFQDADGTQPFYLYTPASVREEYLFSDQIEDNLGKQIQFSLTVPIFNGLQARSAVARAKLNQQAAQLNADFERNQLRQNIEQAAADARAALRAYVASKRQVEALERSFRNAELRLNAGVINSTDFNVIANDYRRAQTDLIQAKYDYFFKLKVLDYYQGNKITF
ncbi:outer membrane protein [Pontibacter ummariensis]|uniref:Outer membrane protein n=1 Tax=Pontibacter ummariensis TaxID=1610492 RepID=A0A239BS50_9BACT|nr:TolC family protein [Pontibacter ummariensis]PRY15653.1 outer membrane protein [Pontibacter ummariensis]SNS10706.1 outer membrane protein [Pontibacter ummariensis]